MAKVTDEDREKARNIGLTIEGGKGYFDRYDEAIAQALADKGEETERRVWKEALEDYRVNNMVIELEDLLEIFRAPNFTDRHGDGDDIDECLKDFDKLKAEKLGGV